MPYSDTEQDTMAGAMTGSDGSFFIRIIRANRNVIDPAWWRYHLSGETFWRFYHNADDGAYVTTSAGTLPLLRGHLYIIPSHLQIDLKCERPVRHFYAHFDVAGLPSIAQRKLFDVPWGYPCEDHHQRILGMVSDELILEAVHLGQPMTITARCWLTTLVYELLARRLQDLPQEQVDRCWHLVERIKPVLPAVDLIEAHLTESLTNLHLAAACSMSEGHFIRTFRSCMGQTPVQYVLERRVQNAAQRLLLTTDSIEKVAEDCGFGSRDYFSRVFARRTGIPPASFRHSHFGDVY